MDLKFVDAPVHGFLERMQLGWRGFFSSKAKVTWTRHYYVLRNDTLYLFEKDYLETPFDSI